MTSLFDTFDGLREAVHQRNRQANKEGPAPAKETSATSSQALDPQPKYQTNHSPSGTQMPEPQDLIPILDACFKNIEIDEHAKTSIIRSILLNVKEFDTISRLQQRLDMLYQHEKNYLTLIKDFKEEIKFIGSMQEDLRKERARFFSDTLKEVTEALNDAKVSNEVASQWLEELVGTYTRSLDLSAGLIEEHTADIIGEIRKQAQVIVNVATVSAKDDEPS